MFAGIIGWMLDNPNIGWLPVTLYIIWEIRGPKGAIHGLRKQIQKTSVTVRALARVHNDIETDEVDEYLDGGKEPHDFITEEEQEEIEQQEKDDAEELIRRGEK